MTLAIPDADDEVTSPVRVAATWALAPGPCETRSFPG